MPPRNRRRILAPLLGAPVLCALLLAAGPPSARADPTTAWGTAGAAYSGGVLCTLDDGTRVPMARWQVDGRPAFSTADVVGTSAGDGPAPVGGAFAPMTAGQGGLDDRGIAVLAELIARFGTGSAARTAEVSAAVAATFGSGDAQAGCLGRQGTSVADEAGLRTAAERYAGPYLVTATPPPAAPPGTAAPVLVTVRSATGVPVPGVRVTAAGAGQSVTGTTSTLGVATVSLTTPRAEQTPVTVTAAQTTGLLFDPGSPGSVALAPATVATTSTVLPADLHPHPALHVDIGVGLVAAGSPVAVVARVSGTYGFAGSGTVTLAGPADPGADGRCSALPAAAFAAAPNAWSQTFGVTGDGAQPVGSSPPLAAGCYIAGGSLSITGSSPVAMTRAPFENPAIIDVVPLVVHRSALPVLALPGRVATTVTVDGVDDASVTSAATVLGPLAPRNGRCDTVAWTGARILSAVQAEPHPPAGGDARSVVLRTPALAAVGCYAVRARTTVAQDGRTLTLQQAAGAPGTVVLVLRPGVALADDTYDTTLGTPMSGRVTVTGTYRYPATLTVRLRSARPHFDGCRSVTFPAGSDGVATVTRTSGDGTFAFRTPPPPANTCYAVDASLQMVDAAQVRVAGPAPTRATVFLAGRPPDLRRRLGPLHRPGSMLRAEFTLLCSVLAVIGLAAAVVVRATVRAGRRRPAPA